MVVLQFFPHFSALICHIILYSSQVNFIGKPLIPTPNPSPPKGQEKTPHSGRNLEKERRVGDPSFQGWLGVQLVWECAITDTHSITSRHFKYKKCQMNCVHGEVLAGEQAEVSVRWGGQS